MISFPKETIGLFVDNIYKNGILFKLDGVFKNNNGERNVGVNQQVFYKTLPACCI
jgi:hypothetical protein